MDEVTWKGIMDDCDTNKDGQVLFVLEKKLIFFLDFAKWVYWIALEKIRVGIWLKVIW